MAIYSLGLNTTITTIAAPAMDFKAAGTNSPKILELGIIIAAATASTYGIGRSANTPTQTGTVLVQAENPGDPAGLTTGAVTWSAAPTVPAQFFRRIGISATVGAGVIWTFPRGISLAAAGPSLVVWNITANSANTNVHTVVDE